MNFAPEIWKAISAHGCETYPEECCGVVLKDADDGKIFAQKIENLQNKMHEEDPGAYPRKAEIAYFMDPKELFRIQRDVMLGKTELLAFYHSHPDENSYFSQEDLRLALMGEEPMYPEATHLIASIRQRKCKIIKGFQWNAEEKNYIEVLQYP